MSPEKWPLARKQKFFRGGPNGKIVAPGILVICSVDKNCDYHTTNLLFAPNIQLVWIWRAYLDPQLPVLVHRPLHFLPTLQHPVQAHLGAHHLVDQVADQDHRIWVKHLYKLVVKTFIFPCRHSFVWGFFTLMSLLSTPLNASCALLVASSTLPKQFQV